MQFKYAAEVGCAGNGLEWPKGLEAKRFLSSSPFVLPPKKPLLVPRGFEVSAPVEGKQTTTFLFASNSVDSVGAFADSYH